MAIQKTEAFVLKTQPFRTSSLIVTTFSRAFGKVKGIAKGVRREGRTQTSTFEPFTHLEIVFYEKIRSELHLISEATILESFEELKSDLEVLATTYYLVELVDHFTEPQDPHEPIFGLLHFAFQSLPSLSPSTLARFFEIRLLHEVGFFPHLENCVSCGKRELERVYFSVRQGGILCPACRQRSPGARLLNPGVLAALQRFISQEGLESLRNPLAEEIEKEMGGIVERFLIERLGRPLRAFRFLNHVRSLKAHPVRTRKSESQKKI